MDTKEAIEQLKGYGESEFLKRQPREVCASSYAHVLALTTALTNLLNACEHADFKNGVSAGVGHPDEGEHWAAVYISAARDVLQDAGIQKAEG